MAVKIYENSVVRESAPGPEVAARVIINISTVFTHDTAPESHWNREDGQQPTTDIAVS